MRVAPLALAAFILVAAFGGYLFLYSSQLPQTKDVTSNLMSFTQRATFTHNETATASSILNSSLFASGQAPIFENLTKEMAVSFTYVLITSVPPKGNLSIQYEVLLSTKDWNSTLTSVPPSALPVDGTPVVSSTRTFDLNITDIAAEIKEIQPSTGYFSSTYVLQVEPRVVGSLSPLESPSNSATITFTPILNMTLANGIIALNGTSYGSSGAVSGTSAVPSGQPALLKNLSYATIAGGVAGIAVSSTFTFRRKKLPSPEKELEAEASFYQEAIAEVAGPPQTTNLVDVSTLRDLVKISDTLGKPILRWRTADQEATKHHYYVLDGQTGYKFELTASETKPQDKPLLLGPTSSADPASAEETGRQGQA